MPVRLALLSHVPGGGEHGRDLPWLPQVKHRQVVQLVALVHVVLELQDMDRNVPMAVSDEDEAR